MNVAAAESIVVMGQAYPFSVISPSYEANQC